jgi:hypothetical protein
MTGTRDAGVFRDSVAQGVTDWNSFGGRILSAALAESKDTEQVAISRRVLSRMLLLTKEDRHLGGKPPYGLRLVREVEEFAVGLRGAGRRSSRRTSCCRCWRKRVAKTGKALGHSRWRDVFRGNSVIPDPRPQPTTGSHGTG